MAPYIEPPVGNQCPEVFGEGFIADVEEAGVEHDPAE